MSTMDELYQSVIIEHDRSPETSGSSISRPTMRRDTTRSAAMKWSFNSSLMLTTGSSRLVFRGEAARFQRPRLQCSLRR